MPNETVRDQAIGRTCVPSSSLIEHISVFLRPSLLPSANPRTVLLQFCTFPKEQPSLTRQQVILRATSHSVDLALW